MTMSQKGGLWNSVDLLSLEGTELLKADANPSTFDLDSDLCLRSLSTAGTEKVAIRFIPPSTRYQFIEIDLLSSTEMTLFVSASTETQAGLSTMHGEIVVADLKITPFVLRTYRFPYLGEIESFVFSGFTSATSVNVKAIRFFTTPDRLVAGVAPETSPSLSVNTAHLTVSGVQVPRVGSIYQLDIPIGETLVTTAVFTFDTLTVSHGLIKILVSQQNHADVEIDITDQTGLTVPYQLTTGYAEIFVTGEQKTVSMVFYNLSGTEVAHVCVELDNWQAITDANAFGLVCKVIVSPQLGIPECCKKEPEVISGSIEYTTPGTYLWYPPAGISTISVSGVGNGGAGGAGVFANSPKGGGGGGSGEGLLNQPMTVTPGGAPVVVVIPNAALGVSGADGNDGADLTVTETVPASALILKGGKGGKITGVGGAGGGIGGGAGGNFGTPTGGSGSPGTAESPSTFSGGSGGGGSGSTGTSNGGVGGVYLGGVFPGGTGGIAGGGGAGGGGGGATRYTPGAPGGDGNTAGISGSNDGHIRVVQANSATGFQWYTPFNLGAPHSPVITDWSYPGMATPIRIRQWNGSTVATYDPTTLNYTTTTTPASPGDDYPDNITTVGSWSWYTCGYHINAAGVRVQLSWQGFYPVGSTGINPGLSSGAMTGSGVTASGTNFGFNAGIPAGEYVGNVVSSTDYKTTYVFTAPTRADTGTAIINKWYKIVNSVVVASGTVSPAIDCVQLSISRAKTYGMILRQTSCFENSAPYCWSTSSDGDGNIQLWSIDGSGNFRRDPVGGNLHPLLSDGDVSIISIGNGYAGVVSSNMLFVISRWATDSAGTLPGVGGGGGGGGSNTAGGNGGVGRIHLSWTGTLP